MKITHTSGVSVWNKLQYGMVCQEDCCKAIFPGKNVEVQADRPLFHWLNLLKQMWVTKSENQAFQSNLPNLHLNLSLPRPWAREAKWKQRILELWS
jgi:hypothetical protein